MNHLKKFISPTVVIVLFILDRATKSWIQKKMFLGESIAVVPGFNLTYLENSGAAFSIGQNQNWFFIVVAIIILIFLGVLRWRWEKMDPENWVQKIAFALLIGGALGNLYDRIRLGSVVDFLDVYAAGYHWPAFNVADSAICVGVALLLITHWSKSAVHSES